MTVDAICNTHSHIREGAVVGPLISYALEGGADVLLPMPNTKDGLITVGQVWDYIAKVQPLVPSGEKMTFIPTIMLTEQTTIGEITMCVRSGIKDAKVYPLHRTTNSENGVRCYERLLPLVQYCGEEGMKVHFHPEHPSMLFGGREAEWAFLPIIDMFMSATQAIIIWEHGTDARCIPFWKEWAKSDRFFVTLTAHHLATCEDEAFGDVRSVCKPQIKTLRDKLDLIRLVEEDHEWVMAGADDAPHDVSGKHVHEGKCVCGAYTAPFLHPLYAHVLLPILTTSVEGVKVYKKFTSGNGRKLHGLPPTHKQFSLQKRPFIIPKLYGVGPWRVEPFWAGRTLDWSIGPV